MSDFMRICQLGEPSRPLTLTDFYNMGVDVAMQQSIRVEDMNRMPPDREQLEQIKTELLAWAGLHRGKAISEEAMPRFHEIIDRLDAIIK